MVKRIAVLNWTMILVDSCFLVIIMMNFQTEIIMEKVFQKAGPEV